VRNCWKERPSALFWLTGSRRLFELRLPTAVDPDIDHEVTPAAKESDIGPVEQLRGQISEYYLVAVLAQP
jgi:hypothetical protein